MQRKPIYDFEIYAEFLGDEEFLKIAYQVWGKKAAATHYDPAEYPEVEVLAVRWNNTCILHMLSPAQMAYINELADDDYTAQMEGEAEEVAEYKADFYRDELRLAA